MSCADVGLVLRLSHVDCLVEEGLQRNHTGGTSVNALEILRHDIFTKERGYVGIMMYYIRYGPES